MMNSVKKFIDSSNKNNSNIVVNSSIIKRSPCTIIYVEGYQDEIFYKRFLSGLFKKNMPRFARLNGKFNVLNISKYNENKKALFIVDKDYNIDNENYENSNLIFTSGYSMENFFYYLDENYNNIDIFITNFIEKYTGHKADYFIEQKFVNGLKQSLNEYKENTINYYALMKTLVGVDMSLKFISSPTDVIDFCNEQIIDFSKYGSKKSIIETRFNENVEFIKKSGFMWIRGHDLFEVTKDYLNKVKIELGVFDEIDDKKILECAEGLNIPKNFRINIKYKMNI